MSEEVGAQTPFLSFTHHLGHSYYNRCAQRQRLGNQVYVCWTPCFSREPESWYRACHERIMALLGRGNSLAFPPACAYASSGANSIPSCAALAASRCRSEPLRCRKLPVRREKDLRDSTEPLIVTAAPCAQPPGTEGRGCHEAQQPS
jgi:hypothetical protein